MDDVKNWLYDMHIHTYFAFCADDEMIPRDIYFKIKREGLKGMALTEHAAQLYVPAQDFWSARVIKEPDLIFTGEQNWMEQYKRAGTPVRRYAPKMSGLALNETVN